MKPRVCPRAWQAEAVHDRLLSRADSVSFDRHARTCAECAAERDALTRLTDLGQRLPTLQTTPLARRALHNELLRRAHENALGASQRAALRRHSWLLAAACSLIITTSLLLQLPRLRSAFGPGEPTYQLTVATPTTRWHVARPGPSLRLALDDGEVEIQVEKLRSAQTFTLQIPDGELEVRGTRFHVQVSRGHTQSVRVDEGHIALRLHGRTELELRRGQSWSLPSPATATRPPPPLANPLPSLASPSVTARPISLPATPSATSARNGFAASASTVVGGTNSRPMAREFAEAMNAFSRGDFATADRLFQAFEERYPQNSHHEDLLFLRALAASRRGDEGSARAFAREYLRQYPSGFRKLEAARLAGDD